MREEKDLLQLAGIYWLVQHTPTKNIPFIDALKENNLLNKAELLKILSDQLGVTIASDS